MFVTGVNQVALLKLEDVKTRDGSPAGAGNPGGQPPVSGDVLTRGQTAFRQHCQACHGADMRGVLPGMPSLVGVTSRIDADAIRAIVQEGQGQMRPLLEIGSADLNARCRLSRPRPTRSGAAAGRCARADRRCRRDRSSPAAARRSRRCPARGMGPFYPGIGGNAGNIPWPDDVDKTGLPPTRYMSGYNVMATYTKPPYTTLTAYDLNTGDIKWQIAPGDHPETIARGGPKGTGGVGARNGILVTSTGLVFHAAGDGKVRAYDEDTGKELWAGDIPGAGARHSGDVHGERAAVLRGDVAGRRRGRSAGGRRSGADRGAGHLARHPARLHRVHAAAVEKWPGDFYVFRKSHPATFSYGAFRYAARIADAFCAGVAAQSPLFDRSISFTSSSIVLPAFLPADTFVHRSDRNAL